MNTVPITPLTLIAAEIGGDANALAVKFGNAVTLDAAGLRCVPTDAAREFITDHRAAVAAEGDRLRAERDAARQRPHPTRERIRAIGRQQEQFDGADVPALGVLLAGDIEARLASSASRMDELMTGDSHYHSLSERG